MVKRVISAVLPLGTVILGVAATTGVSALAQAPVSMVDCVVGGTCIGTGGNDTINASDKQDVIYGFEGDDVIDPGIDSVTDYVYCGPGYDTVDQMPRVVEDTQDAIQYEASEPDVIADDCEVRAL
jgi:hypothetical protein